LHEDVGITLVALDLSVGKFGTKLIQHSVPIGMIFDKHQTMEGWRGLDRQPRGARHVNGLRFGIIATKQRQRRKLLGAFTRARKRIDIDQNEAVTLERGGERWEVGAQARELVLGIRTAETMFGGGRPVLSARR
jgi:hypothetical protein